MIQFIRLVLAKVLVAISVFAPSREVEKEASRSPDLTWLRIECDRLHVLGPHCLGGYQKLNAFIDNFAEARDEKALRFIISHELPGVSHAAARYVKLLGPCFGVKFARTVKPGSRGWRATVCVLSFSGRPEIRAYIQEMIRSPDPEIRAFCYGLDLSRGWGDLVEAAFADINATNHLYEEGFWQDGTLGDSAREYLSHFDKNGFKTGTKMAITPLSGV